MGNHNNRARLREGDCISIDVDKGTIGGDTYWVEHPDWAGEQHALCFRRIKEANRTYDDERCTQAAGYGTDHAGTGACKFHGGAGITTSLSGNFRHGRGAVQMRKILAERIDDYVENDSEQLFDLTYELAAMRVMMRELIDRFPNPNDEENYERMSSIAMQRIMTMIQATGSLVDKISRIESRNTITAAQVLYLRARMADILVKYIPDPDRREHAIQELAHSMPGGNNDAKAVKASLPAPRSS